jgi:hypothetical protein
MAKRKRAQAGPPRSGRVRRQRIAAAQDVTGATGVFAIMLDDLLRVHPNQFPITEIGKGDCFVGHARAPFSYGCWHRTRPTLPGNVSESGPASTRPERPDAGGCFTSRFLE